LISFPRLICKSYNRSFPRSRRKCIKHILMGISGNTSSSASSMPARISDIAPEGILKFFFTFTSISFTLSNDSEWHLSAYSVKPDMASLTTITMKNSESVVPSICSTYEFIAAFSLVSFSSWISIIISPAILLMFLTCLSDMPFPSCMDISEHELPCMNLSIPASTMMSLAYVQCGLTIFESCSGPKNPCTWHFLVCTTASNIPYPFDFTVLLYVLHMTSFDLHSGHLLRPVLKWSFI